jgi:XTP/dITP diphosphohydrolase
MNDSLAPGARVVIASHNNGKHKEFSALAAPYGLTLVSAADLGLPEPEETGTSFAENAAIKALAAAKAAGIPAIGDDSGLAVDALNGAPGIHSARWAGPDRDFNRAMRNLEEDLQRQGAVDQEARRAKFVCVLCLADPAGRTWDFTGEVYGTIVWPPRGDNGFGYDPVFQPEGLQRTFAQMTMADKQGANASGESLSHRARAFAAFARDRLRLS